MRALTRADDSARFRDLVLDPVLLAAHVARIKTDPAARDAEKLQQLCRRALRTGPAALSPAERTLLSSDADSMWWLHREAWREWPVESWQIARDRPQLPSAGSEAAAEHALSILPSGPDASGEMRI